MMKKFLIGAVVVIIGLIVIGSIGKTAGNPAVKDAFNKGQQDAKKALETPKPVKHAVISSGFTTLTDISVWKNPGSGGADNVTVGSVPIDAKVEIIESKEADGVTFYNIRSFTGKVSMLPTDINLREKAKATKPQSEWNETADANFPVEGWISADFVKNIE